MPDDRPSGEESGFRTLVGYRVGEWHEGYAVIELEVAAQHLNRSDVVHGGVYATLIDAAGGYAGCFCAVPGRRRRAFTLSLTTNFIAAATGGRLRAIARKTGGGGRIFFASIEVVDESDRLLATGDGVYRYRSDDDIS